MIRRALVTLLFAVLSAPAGAQGDEQVIEWARGRAVPLGASAFKSLDGELRHVRVIGVGESVHDAEPFHSFRLELLQDLVRRHRVTAVVMETGLPEAMWADDYVRGRSSSIDYEKTFPLGMGTVEEIRKTVEWVRQWNLGEGKKRPVGIHGGDLPNRSGSMVPALDRLIELTAGDAKVRAAAEAIRPVAVRISSGWWKGASDKYAALTPEEKTELSAGVKLLLEAVERVRGRGERLDWARRNAEVIRQYDEFLRLGAFAPTAPRDIALTENVLWLLGRLKKDEKLVYWAHNAHIQKVPVKGGPLPPGSFPASGGRLATALGAKYFAIGTAYGGPSLDRTPAELVGGSVDLMLSKVMDGPFVVSLGGARPATVGEWLSAERPMRFQVDHLTLALGPAFDAVVYFPAASRAARVK